MGLSIPLRGPVCSQIIKTRIDARDSDTFKTRTISGLVANYLETIGQHLLVWSGPAYATARSISILFFYRLLEESSFFFLFYIYTSCDTILWSNFITSRVDVLQVFVYYINVLIFTNFEWDFFCFSRIIPISFASSSCFFEKSARRILLMIWRHGYK